MLVSVGFLLTVILFTLGNGEQLSKSHNSTYAPKTTTEKPTTTKILTTTTTLKPTTTQIPTTTTLKPTTTQTHSTTQEPTTQEPATTSIAPKPMKPVITLNETCIVGHLSILKKDSTGLQYFNEPHPIIVKCNGTVITVKMEWFPSEALTFGFLNKDSSVSLNSVLLSCGKEKLNKTNLGLFKTALGSGYQCAANSTVQLNDTVSLMISDYKMQVFEIKDDADFQNCASPVPSSSTLAVVLIVIACVLVLIVVMVALLVYRKRFKIPYETL